MGTTTDKIISSTLEKDTAQVVGTMFLALLFGVIAVVISLWDHGTICRGLLWTGAWSSVGWFLGFLFGIPRYLSTDTARTPGASALERAKQELAAAANAAKERRAEADAAAKAKDDAVGTANAKALAASQAAGAATKAAEESAKNPGDQALKDAADAAALAAEEAKQESGEAAESAKTAATKAQAAEEAASEADSATEAAKRKEAAASTDATSAPRASLTVNTNLEQVSDWLTKIIVGVSLVESQALSTQMHRAATFMAKSMAKADEVAAWMRSAASAAAANATASAAEVGSAAASTASGVLAAAHTTNLASFASMESVACAIMAYFLATGMLGSYLLTRLFLQQAFDKAATVRSK